MDPQKPSPTTPNDALEIQAAHYDSLYEQIVKPDRALYLPGYFRRWLKYLGPDLAWTYCSFRQAAYMDGGREGALTSRFTVAELANRAGITERTFWNRAASPATWEKLKGLITRVEEDAKWDITSGTPKQLPRKFIVAMTLPLTPMDTASLKKWLTENTETCGGAESVLRAAASTPLLELLPPNMETTTEPMTVRALVMRLFGEQLDAKLLDALASAIQNHIMPSNDQIKITVFFMEHVLAYLGSGAGWVVTLLRDHCFDSEAETRNRVVIRNGYAEIAAWLGISRVKTIWEWLNQKKNDKYINPVFRVYTREQVDERDYDKRERTFHVLLDEVPSEMLEAFATGKGLIAELFAPGADVEHVMAGGDFGANFSLGLADFSAGDFGAFFSHGLADFSAHLGAIFSLGLADFSVPFGANFRVKALKPLNQTLKTPPTQPAPVAEKTPEQPAQSGGRVGWSFSEIAENNALNPKGKADLQKIFADEQTLAEKFLAWILYAHSPLGRGLTDTTGVSKAVKSLCRAQPEFAPKKFERLVKLGPQGLRELFDRDYARLELGKSIEANIYRGSFKKLDAERKSELYFALFGQDNPEPAAKPQVERKQTALQIRLAEIKARKAAQQENHATE
jgi:hypothetical protein